MPDLVTPRLVLTPLTAEDAVHFEVLLGPDHAALMMMPSLPSPCTARRARDWIAVRLEAGARCYGLRRRPGPNAGRGDFLGMAGFGVGAEEAELGYWIGRPFRAKGYATEAVTRLAVRARALGLHRLVAHTFLDNRVSARVLSKAGFRHDGIVLRAAPGGGRRGAARHLLELAGRQERSDHPARSGGCRVPSHPFL